MVKVPQRSEIRPEETWRLEDIYPSEAMWREAIRHLTERVRAFESHRGRLGESGARLFEALRDEDTIWQLTHRIYAYAMLHHDADTEDPHGTAALQEVQGLAAEVAQTLSFIRPELVALPEGRIDSLIEEDERLAPYGYALRQITRRRPHILSAEAEGIISAFQPVLEGSGHVASQLSDADFRFPDVADERGASHPLSHGRYLSYMSSPDRTLRKNTYLTMHEAYRAYKNTFAATLGLSVRQDMTEARLRNYPSTLAMRMDERSLDSRVYDRLIEAVHAFTPDLRRYIAWRKRRLGVEAFHFYDLYVPVAEKDEEEMDWERAKETVRRALAPLGAGYLERTERVLEDRHIDYQENKGKRSGAYMLGIYDVHPYILMSYNKKLEGLFTLIHETGHALHSIYSAEGQIFRNADYTIFLAEIASTFNEHLLHEELLTEADDPATRLVLYDHQLQRFASTVFRQALFAEFEEGIHRELSDRGALTADGMAERYADLLRAYYGADLVLDEPGTYEWARIPHFYRSFYVFQYATGFLLAAALAEAVLRDGSAARDRYLEVLGAGASDDPLNILERAGVSVLGGSVLEDGLSVFRSLVDRVGELG